MADAPGRADSSDPGVSVPAGRPTPSGSPRRIHRNTPVFQDFYESRSSAMRRYASFLSRSHNGDEPIR